MTFKKIELDLNAIEQASKNLKTVVITNFFSADELPDLTQIPKDLNIVLVSTGMCLYKYNELLALHENSGAAIEINKCNEHIQQYAQNIIKAIRKINAGQSPFKTNAWYIDEAAPLLEKLNAGATVFLEYIQTQMRIPKFKTSFPGLNT